MKAVPPVPTPSAPAPSRGLPGICWVLIYVLLVAFPLLILLLGPLPRGGGRWWDFSMALGFAGLAMIGVQFLLTARFQRATAPFGMDIIYYFHRWAAVGGVALVLAHYLILRVGYGDALGPLNPLTSPWPLTAGRLSLLLFLVIIVSSLARQALQLEYDAWRRWHGLLSVAAVILAVAHVAGVGYYTHAPWKLVVWTTYSAMWLLLLAYIRLLKPWRLQQRPYEVTAVKPERGDAWTLTLAPRGGHAPLAFRPGQFAWLSLGRSPFRAREHPFSFSGSAEDPRTRCFTIKELGDFTRTIGQVPVGTVAYVDGPHGVFTPDAHPDASGFVLIAGGVGIAPMMSMLRTLANRGDPRPLRLIFGNSSWDRVLFREELADLPDRLSLQVTHVLHEPHPGWTGATGMLTPEVIRAALPPPVLDHVFFLCGPKPMTDSVQATLRALGVPLSRIHLELFDMA